ncbi:MAG TPA: hypothetical protein VK892_09120 [Pyrinomonadaceae bacterium]|nr:hypothetical protein [Pyrinomonadaceae bacterium]
MYCWSCGTQINKQLNYCSSCGARIDKAASEDYSKWDFMNNPATAVGYLGVFGLGGFIFLVITLIKRNLDPSFVFAISALYLIALFGICFLLIRQMSHLSGKAEPKTNPDDEAAPRAFRSEITAQLESPRQPAISVTENTTKTLDEVLIERK